MKFAALFVTAWAAAVGLSAEPAAAQALPQAGGALPCKPWQELAKELGHRYAERPVALGLQSNGNLLQVFASEATGTWTLVTMHPSGMACLIGVGDSWEMLSKPDADPEA
jgi:hypothetical protein